MWTATLCFILGTSCLLHTVYADTAAVSRQVADATNSFSLDLFKAVLDDNRGNAVASPVSVSTLLALVQQGAEGNTERQLSQVLYLSPEQSKEGYSLLTRNLRESNGNVTLEFANGAFLNKGYVVRPDFKNILEQDFQSSIETVEFAKSTEAAGTINSWVANHTHDKIQNLVSPDALDALTRLVLVNAIYFKDFWKTSFKKEDTRNDIFYTGSNTSKEVSTMHLQRNLLTGDLESLNSRWLQLPFQGDRFYLLIILPNERDGVEYLKNSITGPAVSDLIHNLDSRGYSQAVKLSLPKFKLETTLELVPTLEKIGLTDIFTTAANLTGISDEPVYVSKVIQKAEIEVDEEGATAAAATAILLTSYSAVSQHPPPPLLFNVDHPFHALIVDDLNKVLLFACSVNDPTVS